MRDKRKGECKEKGKEEGGFDFFAAAFSFSLHFFPLFFQQTLAVTESRMESFSQFFSFLLGRPAAFGTCSCEGGPSHTFTSFFFSLSFLFPGASASFFFFNSLNFFVPPPPPPKDTGRKMTDLSTDRKTGDSPFSTNLELWEAARVGNEAVVIRILKENPDIDIDINWRYNSYAGDNRTSLRKTASSPSIIQPPWGGLI